MIDATDPGICVVNGCQIEFWLRTGIWRCPDLYLKGTVAERATPLCRVPLFERT